MKILLADDQWSSRAGLSSLLRTIDQDVSIVEASTLDEANDALAGDVDPDLILLDLVMLGSDAFTGIKALHDRYPESPLVVFSVMDRRSDVLYAIELGARGYIPKAANGDEILKAVKHVRAGDIYVSRALLESKASPDKNSGSRPTTNSHLRELVERMTDRQRDVFALLAQGKSNPEIAKDLGLSSHTVRIHISAILRALGVSNRTQAALLAADHGRSPSDRWHARGARA